MSDINVGQIAEALNDKTDRDMQNVDIVSGQTKNHSNGAYNRVVSWQVSGMAA